MGTARSWQKYPTADTTLDEATLNSDAASHAVNLVRNPYLRAWRGDRPLWWGGRSSTPAVAPARVTTAGQGYRGGAALDWTISAADSAAQLVQDIGGALPPTIEGAAVMTGWPGLTVTLRAKASAASLVRAFIRHGSTDYVSAWHSGGGAMEDLTVTLPPAVAVAVGDSVLVGADFGTSGSTQHVYVDHVQAVLGEWSHGLVLTLDHRLLADLGPAQASWTRRSESGLLMLATANLDGVIRSGDAFVDYTPAWSTILGQSSVRVAAGFFTPHNAGTNLWSTTQLRKITGLDWSNGTSLRVAAQSGQTFGTAGGLLRASILWLLEPVNGVVPYPA